MSYLFYSIRSMFRVLGMYNFDSYIGFAKHKKHKEKYLLK